MLHVFSITLALLLSWQPSDCVLPTLNKALLTGTASLPRQRITAERTKPKITSGMAPRLEPRIFPAKPLPDAPTIQRTFNAERSRIEQQSFDRSASVPDSRREGFGPHLITSPEAIRLSQIGETLLATAESTVRRMGVQSRERVTKVLSDIPTTFIPKRFCPFDQKFSCKNQKYRTIDGSCNNLQNPIWGKSFTPFERFLPPLYDDNIGSPRTKSILPGRKLPLARKISVGVHDVDRRVDRKLSHFTMEMGQVISHDIQRNALSRGYLNQNLDCCRNKRQRNCFHIDIPPQDPHFTRTCMNFVRALPSPSLDCKLGVRQQMNQNSHYLDASFIYGSDIGTMNSLRTKQGGLMRTTNNQLLPQDSSTFCPSPAGKKCFKAGDVRVNQQAALISLHTIWLKEHNRVAKVLKTLNPSWSDETLFQEARKIVGAELQHVTYNEFLPKLLGDQMMRRHDLKPKSQGYYNGYDQKVKPMIRNAFSAAAYRVGHSLISHELTVKKRSSPAVRFPLHSVFLEPDLVYSHGVSAVTRGLYESNAHESDKYLTREITRHLFERGPRTGQDLASINIQRGRDHGIADYNTWRDACGLGIANNHNGLNLHTTRDKNLLKIYEHVFDIDLFTGGVSEKSVAGGNVGPTFACLIALQFQALKQGDRFYYENGKHAGKLTIPQLNEIRKTSMAKIICDNTDITSLPRDVFLKKSNRNKDVACYKIPGVDLRKWKVPCVARWGPWGPFSSSRRGCKIIEIRRRTCIKPRGCPNAKCSGDETQTRIRNVGGSDIFNLGGNNCAEPIRLPIYPIRPSPDFPRILPDIPREIPRIPRIPEIPRPSLAI